MNRTMYKEFEIQAAPFQSVTTKKWLVNIYIVEHNGRESVAMKYVGSDFSCASESDAMRQCFQLGRLIVDEKVSVIQGALALA